MADTLFETLRRLPAEPAEVVDLYGQLYAAEFFVFVRAGTEHSVQAMEFLTYDCADQIQELPIFTATDFVLKLDAPGAVLIKLSGPVLWPRLLDIIQTRVCEAAVDPVQPHGIRLNVEMILGMVNSSTDSTADRPGPTP
jgi:hypothetical protein